MSAFTFTHILLLFGILQALQLSVVLALRPQGNRPAVWCLQALLLVCALLLADYLMLTTGKSLAFPVLAGFSIPFAFALGPLLLAYVACQTGSAPRRRWGWHLLPMVACALVLLFAWGPVPIADKREWLTALMSNGYRGSQLEPLVICLVLCLQQVLYSYHADLVLERYDNALRQQEAGSNVQLVRWLRLVTRGFCLFQLLFYLAWAEWLYIEPTDWYYTSLAMGCLALLLSGAGLWSQLHPALFQHATLSPLPVLPSAAPRYAKSKLDPARLAACLALLDRCMREQQPYLDPELRLPRLADLCGLTPHLLSQVINEGYLCNYFEYVNRQRIAHAQALLRSGGGGNLLEIALASGFNSKATFNRSFVALTGVTPSAWLAANTAPTIPVNR